MSIINKISALPIPAQVIIYGGGVYGIYKGAKFAKSHLDPNSELNVNKKALETNKTDADEILKNNLHLPPEQQQLPTFSKSQYKDFAQTLFVAMDGAGTDLPAIHDVFKKMQNDLDILYLNDAFGTRTGTSMFASNTPTNLADWLEGDGATKTVNDVLDTKKSVTRRF